MKSVIKQGFSYEFAFDNKVLKTFIKFWICWKEIWKMWTVQYRCGMGLGFDSAAVFCNLPIVFGTPEHLPAHEQDTSTSADMQIYQAHWSQSQHWLASAPPPPRPLVTNGWSLWEERNVALTCFRSAYMSTPSLHKQYKLTSRDILHHITYSEDNSNCVVSQCYFISHCWLVYAGRHGHATCYS